MCAHVPGRPPGDRALVGRAGLRAADDLAGFLAALHVPAPVAAPRSPHRGVPLAARDETVRSALAVVPTGQRPGIERLWMQARQAPTHSGPDLWLHGDLHGLNVLVARDRITGVIDFGDLCGGDPATDLAAGWLLLDRPGRDRFREALDADDAAWARGRGWAIFFGLMFLAHSAGAPVNGAIGRRALLEVLGEGH